MKDTIRKALLIGIGSVYYSGKQLDKMMRNFSEQHNLSKDEADKLIKELMDKGKKLKEDQQKHIESFVKDLIKKSNLASKDEITKLKKEIADLKKQISEKDTKKTKRTTKKKVV